MATLKRQKARKEYVCSSCEKPIKMGDEYYKFSQNRFQKLRPLCLACKPTRSQMTGSEFLSTMYAIEEEMATLTIDHMEDAQNVIEGIVGQLEELRDETEEKHDNMPESLYDSPVGETLQNRVDSVEEMLGELADIETEIEDEPTEKQQLERYEEILEEIQSVCYNGE